MQLGWSIIFDEFDHNEFNLLTMLVSQVHFNNLLVLDLIEVCLVY